VDYTCTPFDCNGPDPVPGSLADAAEALRAKVAWPHVNVDELLSKVLRTPAVYDSSAPEVSTAWYRLACEESLRVRIIFFLAALGVIDASNSASNSVSNSASNSVYNMCASCVHHYRRR
jgi:hypothetical protein